MTHSEWQTWQLVDSAFPTGGFAHSAGLEAIWAHRQVRNGQQLASFVHSALWQLGHGALPFVAAAHDDLNDLGNVDQSCHVSLSNSVANRASRLQGAAWLATGMRVFSVSTPALPHGHLAPAFGAVLQRLIIDLQSTLRLFVFHHMRGLISAAVRLNIVGPLEGQKIQSGLFPLCEEVARECGQLKLSEVAQTSPLIELLHGTHDRLYSRLFQS